VQILDASGQQVWSKELPLQDGRLSADHARRLARALAVAAHGPNMPAAPRPAVRDAGVAAIPEPSPPSRLAQAEASPAPTVRKTVPVPSPVPPDPSPAPVTPVPP